MNRRPPYSLALAALGWVLAGCAPKEEPVWVQPPQVLWLDLATAHVPAVDNGYLILESGPSEGRFPCSLAVSRVAVEDGPSRRRYVPVTPRNEFLTWNSAFDDQWPIAEVFPIAERALGGDRVTSARLVAMSDVFGAGLGLLYGFNELTETQCEMIGVLHDARAGEAIAVIHASAESIPRPEDDETDNNVDAWEYEARALVRDRFERLLVDCIRELIARDQPLKSSVPEGWIPQQPVYPPGWPRRSP
ncbi:MAG: hypothetical protein C4547_01220 [Phycisphaerales bacterium]|nr:MAG: hypothetical protein C4547_01220 [Phycisphaerales bacterium]